MGTTALKQEVAENVSHAAKLWSKGNAALVDALAKAREAGEDSETINGYRDLFYVQAIAAQCKLSPTDAEAEFAKSPYDFVHPASMTEANRSPGAQRVFNAAKMAWSRAREAAGFECKKAPPKAKLAPGQVPAQTAKPKLKIVSKLAMPAPAVTTAVIGSPPEAGPIAEVDEPADSLSDILNRMEILVDALDAARWTNAKLFSSPAGIVLDKAITAFIDGVSEAWALIPAADDAA